MNQTETKNNSVDTSKATILVVEDDKFLRELMLQKLQKEGFETQAAVDAEEAFKLINEKKPHLILLDLVLPGMDGFAMKTLLKKRPETADIPIIILSNLGQKEDIERATNDGVEGYLVKASFTTSEIVDKVRAVLSKRYG